MVNTPDNKRKLNSKERMVRALLRLIQDKRIKDISVSELCKTAKVNRTTFYNNYDNILELAEDARQGMVREYVSLYAGNTYGHTPENYLKMFRHIKENQIFYRTYFILCPESREMYEYYDRDLAKAHDKNKHVEYHIEFFAAGFTAIIKLWLDRNCKETPEEMLEVLMSEYEKK